MIGNFLFRTIFGNSDIVDFLEKKFDNINLDFIIFWII